MTPDQPPYPAKKVMLSIAAPAHGQHSEPGSPNEKQELEVDLISLEPRSTSNSRLRRQHHNRDDVVRLPSDD